VVAEVSVSVAVVVEEAPLEEVWVVWVECREVVGFLVKVVGGVGMAAGSRSEMLLERKHTSNLGKILDVKTVTYAFAACKRVGCCACGKRAKAIYL